MTAKSKKRSKAQEGDIIQRLGEALRHPLRSRILEKLGEGVYSPVEMSQIFEEEVGNVDYHVKRLEKLGLAEIVRTAPRRGATEHWYRATSLVFGTLAELQKLPKAVANHYAGDFLRMLNRDFIEAAEAGAMDAHDDLHLTRTPRVLDKEGYDEVLEIWEQARLAAEEAEVKSAERLAASGERGVRVATSLLCHPMASSDYSNRVA